MTMKTIGSCAGAAVAVLLLATTASAQVTRVRCENGKYRYCSARTDNQVRMIEQISEARCEQGKSWGFDRDGVWVDHDCVAEFEVGRSGPSTSEKVMAGATAGVAVLQAMLANRAPQAEPAPAAASGAAAAASGAPATARAGGPPAWMVGTFQAVEPQGQKQVYVTISANGLVEGRMNDTEFFGKVRGEQIVVGTQVFGYRQEGDALVVFRPGQPAEGLPMTRVATP
jgi:hypothetical protein